MVSPERNSMTALRRRVFHVRDNGAGEIWRAAPSSLPIGYTAGALQQAVGPYRRFSAGARSDRTGSVSSRSVAARRTVSRKAVPPHRLSAAPTPSPSYC